LDGGQSGLDLPSMEVRPIIGEDGLPKMHALFWTVTRGELTYTGWYTWQAVERFDLTAYATKEEHPRPLVFVESPCS
jgi:hypothetical protein